MEIKIDEQLMYELMMVSEYEEKDMENTIVSVLRRGIIKTFEDRQKQRDILKGIW